VTAGRCAATVLLVAFSTTVLVLATPAPTATAVGEPAALQRQWTMAAGRAVKIEVRKDGWYRVARARLKREGADVARPDRLRLYADGKEVPTRIDRGSVEFYGQALDTPSTDTRTYWLVPGATPGPHIRPVTARTQRGSGFARSFPFALERKYRTIYSTLQNGERQNYFGDMIYSKPTTLALRVRDQAERTGVLDVAVQGLSTRSHRIKVVLNRAGLGMIAFNAQANVSRRFVLPRGLLHEGANSLTLTSVGGDADVSFIDTTRLTYPRQYRAEHDALRFSLRRNSTGWVTGFSRSNVTVIDVTRPASPRLLRPTVRRSSGGFAAVIAPSPRARLLLALTKPAQPAAVERNRVSHWHEPGGADLVIIAHRRFFPQLARLKAYPSTRNIWRPHPTTGSLISTPMVFRKWRSDGCRSGRAPRPPRLSTKSSRTIGRPRRRRGKRCSSQTLASSWRPLHSASFYRPARAPLPSTAATDRRTAPFAHESWMSSTMDRRL
jgi:hypothetical protein